MEPWSVLWSNCKSKRVEDRLCSRRIEPRARHSTKADMICASPKSQSHHQGGEGGMVGPAPKGPPLSLSQLPPPPSIHPSIHCPNQPWTDVNSSPERRPVTGVRVESGAGGILGMRREPSGMMRRILNCPLWDKERQAERESRRPMSRCGARPEADGQRMPQWPLRPAPEWSSAVRHASWTRHCHLQHAVSVDRAAGPAWKPATTGADAGAGGAATAEEAGAWRRHMKHVTVALQFRGCGTLSPTCRRQGQPFLLLPSVLRAACLPSSPSAWTCTTHSSNHDHDHDHNHNNHNNITHPIPSTPVPKQATPPPRKANTARPLRTHLQDPFLSSCTPTSARHMSAAHGTKRHIPSAVPWPLSTLLHFVSLTQIAARGPSLPL
ncbi:hypothetical protein COCMIDRAFT_39043 [Bipolaris oryzae ATCC 44560]|uniref:Uncharacterized protein n=1 Tax=Bipolaris oryzae ATCC 44560 TaxID=930090 RepID=W6YZA3_COCMI|nr:uncharacterized protein COCMIDRAFT_39043 [Bipolaris oryzae ATCC 44560]EUC42930.1 hypothetical protein COCMIDRAFT_39043 [Bipolaris oryzae ATCC 44560]